MITTDAGPRPDAQARRRVARLLTGLILFSFAVGVIMFLPAEHRAEKFAQIKQKYEAKQQHRLTQYRQTSADGRR